MILDLEFVMEYSAVTSQGLDYFKHKHVMFSIEYRTNHSHKISKITYNISWFEQLKQN